MFPVWPSGAGAIPGVHYAQATTDPETIKYWFTDPDFCVAVYPGEAGVAVDLDVKGGKDGPGEWARLCPDGDNDPPTQTTRSGGVHKFYATPHPTRGTQGDRRDGIAPGIDTRACDGYVFAYGPPPCHRLELPELPTHVLERLPRRGDRAHVESIGDDQPDGTAEDFERGKRYAESYPPAIAFQGGDNHTFKLCAYLRRNLNLSYAQAGEIFDEWNRWCEPPWDDHDRHRLLTSGARNGSHEPGRDATPAEVLAGIYERVNNAATTGDIDDDLVEPERRHSRMQVLDRAAMRALPPPSYLIQDILPREDLGQIFADKKSFKTFIALNMAWSVAEGTAWGCNGDDVIPGFDVDQAEDVLYCYGEGPSGAQLRMDAMAKSLGRKPGDWPERLRFMPYVPRLITECGAFAEILNDLAAEGFHPRLIVFDTYTKAMAGFNQNSDQDVGAFCAKAREIVADYGCTVLLLHHTGHQNKERGRGSSVAGGDFGFSLGLLTNKDDMTTALYVDDMRDGAEDLEPVAFQGEVVPLGEDDKGRPRTSLAFKRARVTVTPGSGDTAKFAVEVRHARAVLNNLEPDERLSRRALARKIMAAAKESGEQTRGETRIKGWLKEAEAAGTDLNKEFGHYRYETGKRGKWGPPVSPGAFTGKGGGHD